MTRVAQIADIASGSDQQSDWVHRNSAVVSLGLSWLRERLGEYVTRLRSEKPPAKSPAGAQPVVTDMQADWLLRRGAHCGYPPGERSTVARRLYIEAREAMHAAGAVAAIDRLSAIFGLSAFEEDVILMAVAPYRDAAFSALYGYAHDRLAMDRPTPHLVCALVSDGDPVAASMAWGLLAPEAPLRRHELVHASAENFTALAPLITDEAIARYVCGDDGRDIRLGQLLAPVPTAHLTEALRTSAHELSENLRTSDGTAAAVCGPPRSGRRAIAAEIARTLNLDLQELQLAALPAGVGERQAVLRLVARESRLHGLAVLVDQSQAQGESAALARDLLAEPPSLAMFIAARPNDLPGHLPSVRTTAIDETGRIALWRQALGGGERRSGSVCEVLAQHFQLGPAEVAQVASQVAASVAGPDIWHACREAACRGLDELADGIEPRFGWDDIVLPADIIADLKAISAQVRHRAAVYGQGGFAGKLVRGRGVSALFAGPSGVGKTMAAEVIARDLDLALYRIDLSRVISKYIGETEQNLRRVFDAAEAGGAVLFFDEADALFGKRSEVKDSHDRYANIEISYLLQRMETYSGLAILATNLKSHIDAAFLRRLRFVIDLPFPDAALREKIWASAFPAETRTEGLDFRALGRLEVSGGNIVVIAVNAAFLAAAEKTPVRMGHIAQAARSEMRKLDKQLKPGWPLGGVR